MRRTSSRRGSPQAGLERRRSCLRASPAAPGRAASRPSGADGRGAAAPGSAPPPRHRDGARRGTGHGQPGRDADASQPASPIPWHLRRSVVRGAAVRRAGPAATSRPAPVRCVSVGLGSDPECGYPTYGKDSLERHVVRVHAVADRVGERLVIGQQHPEDRAQRHVDDVVGQTTTVREPGDITVDHTERGAVARARRDRHVQAQHLAGVDAVRLVQPGDAGQEDLDQVARWIPGALLESGTSVPYTAFSRCGSSGSWTAGRYCASFFGLEALK